MIETMHIKFYSGLLLPFVSFDGYRLIAYIFSVEPWFTNYQLMVEGYDQYGQRKNY